MSSGCKEMSNDAETIVLEEFWVAAPDPATLAAQLLICPCLKLPSILWIPSRLKRQVNESMDREAAARIRALLWTVWWCSAESTHRPPTQTETHSLAADRARIAVIKAKITELERSLSSLNEEKDLLQERIDGYTYPVLTLPNEIVSEIFVHFLPVYPDPPPIIGRSSPNVLGQICRKWRDIAFSTPALWRGIALSLQNGKRLDQKLRLLETWLQRSGSCLLSINMDLAYAIAPVASGSFLASIAAHSRRWEHLQLCSSDLPFPSIVAPFPSIVAPFPFLRTLYMSLAEPVESNTQSPISPFHAAPLLRTVVVFPWHHSDITLYPWSQLTTFTALLIFPDHCVDVLSQTVNLTYCKLSIRPGYGDGPKISQSVTLPHLETFIIRGSFYSNLSWRFLDIFTLPALHKFQASESILQGQPVNTLKSLFSRSRCNVQELEAYLRKLTVSRCRQWARSCSTIWTRAANK
ncbi:hypothetical protein C8F04DRAFT_1397768 [Mycena alexandri]|uniref:F-box domain-containing protein n=1 Tax=Mycena alexandri TaxID=1745969 RepID=A0AAD6SNU3_9AGAR|nr:hypothetical protein C8F04DRAFT_1397768 [Mycena alexandri]